MNKKFHHYAVIWGILFALFLIISILVPTALKIETEGYAIGLIGGIIAFLGVIVCAWKVYQQENLRKFFYNLPILSILHGALYLITLLGIACMLVPQIPAWAGAVICLLVFAFTAIAVVKASAAAEIISEIDEKTAAQTSFMKQLRAKAGALTGMAQEADTKAALKRIEEMLKYSDPVSRPETMELEEKIAVQISEIKDSLVKAGRADLAGKCQLIEALLKERNDLNKSLRK